MKKYLTSGAIIAALAVAGCSGKTHQSSQAAATDTSSGGISQMPSGFRNVSYKCVKVGGQWFALFSASDGGNHDNLPAAIAAVAAPNCKVWGP